ncbi:MAG: bifunctional diaminohydroxyphosphoribosylaminopyrimidine deaminase/5-amino-6-(5-phosphoribosylamino)uracil reductase RibD [Nitrospirota bacterium]
MRDDEYYMRLCLSLAKKGKGRTSPNPIVGAVVVKDDKIIGKGYHKKAGLPHAEAIAISKAGSDAEGSTLYISLEPCCHSNKKTPPCTKKIIESKIKKVVIGMIDPNPLVSGKGIEELLASNIEVKTGVLEDEAKKINESFVKYIKTKTPFVILKIAESLDGKIATNTGESKWITGETAREYAHKLRDEVDAVLVGIGTVLRDNPSLTTRLKNKKGKDPIRVVVDSGLRIPLSAKLLTQKANARTIIATSKTASKGKIEKIKKTGAEIILLKTKNSKIPLTQLMKELGKREITSLMIEGGSEIAASAIKEAVVDKVVFFIALKIITGINAKPSIGGEGIKKLKDALMLKDVSVKRIGEDIMVEGYVRCK